MVSSLDKYFTTMNLSHWVLHDNMLYLILEYSNFLNSVISQGSVATFVRCGGIFNVDVIANLLTSLSVKKLWKSVRIWRSYWKCGYLFSLAHPVCTVCMRYGIIIRYTVSGTVTVHKKLLIMSATKTLQVIVIITLCRKMNISVLSGDQTTPIITANNSPPKTAHSGSVVTMALYLSCF